MPPAVRSAPAPGPPAARRRSRPPGRTRRLPADRRARPACAVRRPESGAPRRTLRACRRRQYASRPAATTSAGRPHRLGEQRELARRHHVDRAAYDPALHHPPPDERVGQLLTPEPRRPRPQPDGEYCVCSPATRSTARTGASADPLQQQLTGQQRAIERTDGRHPLGHAGSVARIPDIPVAGGSPATGPANPRRAIPTRRASRDSGTGPRRLTPRNVPARAPENADSRSAERRLALPEVPTRGVGQEARAAGWGVAAEVGRARPRWARSVVPV